MFTYLMIVTLHKSILLTPDLLPDSWSRPGLIYEFPPTHNLLLRLHLSTKNSAGVSCQGSKIVEYGVEEQRREGRHFYRWA